MNDLIKLPYGKGALDLSLPSGSYQLIKGGKRESGQREQEIIDEALSHPIGGKSLRELSQNARKITIITNDNTRPMPSKITLPALINALFHPAEHYDITILIATGLHRPMSPAEMEEQYGPEICGAFTVVNHDARDTDSLVSLGKMSTGNEMFVNKLVAESDLVISEGFIEPHIFAGFSGGRKSILPGVSGASTIINNHDLKNTGHPNARRANLEGNPVHAECLEGAMLAGLKFILNVALDEEKHIIGAFAGDPLQAHEAGCAYVRELMCVPAKRTDITITTNSGYPLDRNLYQVAKGIDTASAVTKESGVLIIAAECCDGIGHPGIAAMLQNCKNAQELLSFAANMPPVEDKWALQLAMRTFANKTVILVNETLDAVEIAKLFIRQAPTVEEALKIAWELKGPDASISVMPEGPVVIPLVEE